MTTAYLQLLFSVDSSLRALREEDFLDHFLTTLANDENFTGKKVETGIQYGVIYLGLTDVLAAQYGRHTRDTHNIAGRVQQGAGYWREKPESIKNDIQYIWKILDGKWETESLAGGLIEAINQAVQKKANTQEAHFSFWIFSNADAFEPSEEPLPQETLKKLPENTDIVFFTRHENMVRTSPLYRQLCQHVQRQPAEDKARVRCFDIDELRQLFTSNNDKAINVLFQQELYKPFGDFFKSREKTL
ncbi:MAG: hypothetical protein LBN05_02650 [Oscillospiraceae bacterium]|jgi:hypothetical protein|nr:hypothetical protein [Oscillospiraceae bacterium]